MANAPYVQLSDVNMCDQPCVTLCSKWPGELRRGGWHMPEYRPVIAQVCMIVFNNTISPGQIMYGGFVSTPNRFPMLELSTMETSVVSWHLCCKPCKDKYM